MDQDPLIGTTVGSYRIDHLLGEGGMGAVYLATHAKLGREVAFKILPPLLVKDNPSFVERFFVEARAAARVDHPNIVRVYDADEVDGKYYIAMEYVRGMDLKDLIGKSGALSNLEAAEISLQAARGLAAAAEANIIHRDIKPANLMITEKGVVKVADFGLAKNTEAATGLTQSGQVMGTPAYMSPEQAEGVATDFRTDIYSLGVTLFEMLTGERPFRAETTLGLLRKHLDAPIPDPVERKADVNPVMGRLVQRMLAKQRDDRFASYDELVGELTTVKAALEAQAAGAPGAPEVDENLMTLHVFIDERLREDQEARLAATLKPGEEVVTPVTASPAQAPAAPTDVQTPPPSTNVATGPPATHAQPAVAAAPGRGLHPVLWVFAGLVVLAGTAAVLYATGVLDRFLVDKTPAVTARAEAGAAQEQWRAVEWVFEGRNPENIVRGQVALERAAGLFAEKEFEKAAAEYGRVRDLYGQEVTVGRQKIDQLAGEVESKADGLVEAGNLKEALAGLRTFLKLSGIPGETAQRLQAKVEAIQRRQEELLCDRLEKAVRTEAGPRDYPALLREVNRVAGRARYEETRARLAALRRDLESLSAEEEKMRAFPGRMRALAGEEKYDEALAAIDAFAGEAVRDETRQTLAALRKEIRAGRDRWAYGGVEKKVRALVDGGRYDDAFGALDDFLEDAVHDGMRARAAALRNHVFLEQTLEKAQALLEEGGRKKMEQALAVLNGFTNRVRDAKAWDRIRPLRERIERDLAEIKTITEADLVVPRIKARDFRNRALRYKARIGAAGYLGEIDALWAKGEKALAGKRLLRARRAFEACKDRALDFLGLLPKMEKAADRAGRAAKARTGSRALSGYGAAEFKIAENAYQAAAKAHGEGRFDAAATAFENAEKAFMSHQAGLARLPASTLSRAAAGLTGKKGLRLGTLLAGLDTALVDRLVLAASPTVAEKLLDALTPERIFSFLSRQSAPDRSAFLGRLPLRSATNLAFYFAVRRGALQTPSSRRDHRDNPVVKRGTSRRDRASGMPLELWLRSPRLALVLVPAGSFSMGSPAGESGRYGDEGPVRTVTFDRPFYLGKYEVTQAQWQAVMGSNPSRVKKADHPVENVSWKQAQTFLRRLSSSTAAKAGVNLVFRLPTEAEFEYALRAGTATAFASGAAPSSLGRMAWIRSNASGSTHPVGGKAPNAWGLYDMHGNVLEWCADPWLPGYKDAPGDGHLARMGSGPARVLRGGSWTTSSLNARAACRHRGMEGSRRDDRGLRVALWLERK